MHIFKIGDSYRMRRYWLYTHYYEKGGIFTACGKQATKHFSNTFFCQSINFILSKTPIVNIDTANSPLFEVWWYFRYKQSIPVVKCQLVLMRRKIWDIDRYNLGIGHVEAESSSCYCTCLLCWICNNLGYFLSRWCQLLN